MNQEPTAAETLLVAEVTGRIERALADQWQLPGSGLYENINALRAFGVSQAVMAGLHYLREERNRVLHHPRRPLRDVARFRALADEVLPVVERRPAQAAPLQSVSQQLRSIVDSHLQRLLHARQSAAPASERVAQMVQAALNRLRDRHAQPKRAGGNLNSPAGRQWLG